MRDGPKPAPRDAHFFADPLVDDLLRALATLAMELSITRDRLAALEQQVQAAHGKPLDNRPLEPDIERAQAAARLKLVQDVFGPMVERLSRSG